MSSKASQIFAKARASAKKEQREKLSQQGIFSALIEELRPVKANPPPADSHTMQ